MQTLSGEVRARKESDELFRLAVLLGTLLPFVGVGAFFIGAGYGAERSRHDTAASFYKKCRDDLGLFEPMTSLKKGESACSVRIETELGIRNDWKDEMP